LFGAWLHQLSLCVPRLEDNLLLLGKGILLNFLQSLNHLLVKLLLLIHISQRWLGSSSGCSGVSCGSCISIGDSLVVAGLDKYYVFVVIVDFNSSRGWVTLKGGTEDGLFGLMPTSNHGGFDEGTEEGMYAL
jgi:hypothetical protein